MKVTYTTRTGLTFHLEGTQVEIFRGLCEASTIFEPGQCGACKSEDLSPIRRMPKGYEYLEWRCDKCGARLGLGKVNDDSGALFPQLKDKDGEYKPNHGWEKYQPENGGSAPPVPSGPEPSGHRGSESASAPPESMHPRLRQYIIRMGSDPEQAKAVLKEMIGELRKLKGDDYALSVWGGIKGKSAKEEAAPYIFNAIQMAESAVSNPDPMEIGDDDVPF